MIQSFRRYFALSFSVLFLIGNIVVPALGQAEKKEDLIGHWTFENGVELEDLTGHFGDIDLLDADVKDGKLHIGNNEWAMTTGYKGPEDTLVTWIYLDDLSITRGTSVPTRHW